MDSYTGPRKICGKAKGSSYILEHRTPLEVGKAVADQHIALLQSGLPKLLAKYAHAILGAYATYFWAESKYTRENNNHNYIPQSCQILFALQPTTRVAKSDGF